MLQDILHTYINDNLSVKVRIQNVVLLQRTIKLYDNKGNEKYILDDKFQSKNSIQFIHSNAISLTENNKEYIITYFFQNTNTIHKKYINKSFEEQKTPIKYKEPISLDIKIPNNKIIPGKEETLLDMTSPLLNEYKPPSKEIQYY